METKQIKERLLNVFSDIEKNKNENALFLLDSVLKSIEKSEAPSDMQRLIEQKESIKITKNTKGFNYEFRVLAKENVDLLTQVDYIQKELAERVKSWEVQK